ncbi:MAG: DUF3570 domain-containing protein, partial [Myxococcales bacterium]|nr:DUF3570 domain-containing protein [Myxococcales bacterium]
ATFVLTPRVRARAALLGERTHLDIAYAADIWTSASIDIRTAATSAVTEERDEIELGLDHELPDLTLRLGYRFSHEPDYVSNTVSASASLALAEKSSTVDARLFFAFDRIGRSGELELPEGQQSLGLRLAFTQIVDPLTLLHFVYEGSRASGYQSSPYRFVGIGGDGLCGGAALLCIPEVHPDLRWRHAGVVRGRRALGESGSLGLGYRLYADSWGLWGHTLQLAGAWLPSSTATLTLRYRMHRQSGATFYRGRYAFEDLDQQPYFTRDRELGGMWSHRLSLALEKEVEVSSAGTPLLLTFSIAGTDFVYDDFAGLGEVMALDLMVSARWQM